MAYVQQPVVESQTAEQRQPAVGEPDTGRTPSSLAEARLVRRARSGSEDAIRELVSTYWPLAHRAAYLITRDRYRAEDIAQEALLRCVAALGDFDPQRPFAPWLHRAVVNRALDALRAEGARPQPAGDAELEAPANDSEVDAEVTPDPAIVDALGRLLPEDRAAVVLRYVLDYRAAEIGEVLGMPAATVRTRLHRAMVSLRDALEVSR